MSTLNASPVLRRMKSWGRVGLCVSVGNVGLRDIMTLVKDIDIYTAHDSALICFSTEMWIWPLLFFFFTGGFFFKYIFYTELYNFILTKSPNVLSVSSLHLIILPFFCPSTSYERPLLFLFKNLTSIFMLYAHHRPSPLKSARPSAIALGNSRVHRRK